MHFPITLPVVVPYYPVNDDMANVRGDDEEVWKAHVLSFDLRRQVVLGRFFVASHDSLWVPEATHPQAIHFRSILGIASSDWMDDSLSSWKST